MDSLISVVQAINDQIINPVIGLIFVAALAFFFWGGFQFIANAGNEEARTKGKRHMLWGIIGMFLMVAVFGILAAVLNTFQVGDLPGGIDEQLGR